MRMLSPFFGQDFVRRHIVAEVPNEMAACIDCDAITCTGERYRHCAARLARAASLDETDADSGRPPETLLV